MPEPGEESKEGIMSPYRRAATITVDNLNPGIAHSQGKPSMENREESDNIHDILDNSSSLSK
jgi:hypothetical protein